MGLATPDSRLPVAFMRDPLKRLTRRTFLTRPSSADSSSSDSDDSDSDDDSDDDDSSDDSSSSASSSSGSASSSERSSTASSSSSSSSYDFSRSSTASSTSSSSSSSSSEGGGYGAYPSHGKDGGIYAIDEEAQDGIMGMLNRFRYKYGTPTKFALKFSLRIPRVEGNQNDNIPFLTYILYSQTAAKRRHPGLLKLEDRAVADAEAKEMAAIERDREHIRQQRADLEKLVAQEQRMDFLDRVAREDRVRFESELSRRAKQLQGRLVGGDE